MSKEGIDAQLTRLNRLSDSLLGDPAEVETVEAEELLKTAGIDPAQFTNSLYQRGLQQRENYVGPRRAVPPLLEKALEDLQPPTAEPKVAETAASRKARSAITHLLREVADLPKKLNAGFVPAFTTAYRNRTELSAHDKKLLDQVAEDCQRKSISRPGERRRSREERDVERLGPIYARALLAELKPKPGAVREIAAALHLDLREAEAVGFEGALIRAKDVPLGAIVIRNSIREAGRKNFTIAHEIGHFVLPGHEHASVACTASEIGDWAEGSTKRQFEREANEFAAELLMPVELVEAIATSAAPSLDVIDKIAREFGASLSAAAWRYCDLAAEKCAVIWSTDGAIQWAKRSAGFPFFLRKGWPVEEGTFAAACFAGEKVPGQPRAVPAHLWTSSVTADSTIRISEQSKALPAYRSVISLLWIEDNQSAARDDDQEKQREHS
jgi:hypothetical protein